MMFFIVITIKPNMVVLFNSNAWYHVGSGESDSKRLKFSHRYLLGHFPFEFYLSLYMLNFISEYSCIDCEFTYATMLSSYSFKTFLLCTISFASNVNGCIFSKDNANSQRCLQSYIL